ncbi:hypothetical protein T484DRAFT_1977766 [Baffinella frigidus]|nr:hypothetical protein T484DRAFT_1977766 [Cryptophyta sp. CCMP2293]
MGAGRSVVAHEVEGGKREGSDGPKLQAPSESIPRVRRASIVRTTSPSDAIIAAKQEGAKREWGDRPPKAAPSPSLASLYERMLRVEVEVPIEEGCGGPKDTPEHAPRQPSGRRASIARTVSPSDAIIAAKQHRRKSCTDGLAAMQPPGSTPVWAQESAASSWKAKKNAGPSRGEAGVLRKEVSAPAMRDVPALAPPRRGTSMKQTGGIM